MYYSLDSWLFVMCKQIIRVEIFKSFFSVLYIYECVNEYFKNIFINIICGFLVEILKRW